MDNGLFLLAEGELWLFAWTLTIPRILGAIIVMPFLSSSTLPGLVRNGVVMVLSVVAVPMTIEQVKDLPLEVLPLMIIVIKEVILGFMMGFMFSIPFWAVSAAGYFIDMQRGTMSGEQFAAIITDRSI